MKKYNIADQIVAKVAKEVALSMSRQYGGAAATYMAAAEEEVAYAAYRRNWKEVENNRRAFRAAEFRKELKEEALRQRRRLDKKAGGPQPSGINWQSRQIAIISAFSDTEKCCHVAAASGNTFAFALQRFSVSKNDTEFAKRVIENHLDKRAVQYQCINFIDDTAAVGKLTSYGMNNITRKLFDKARVAGPSQFVDHAVVRTVDNKLSVSALSRPFTDEILQVNLQGVGGTTASRMGEHILKNMLTIQYAEDGDIVCWIRVSVKGYSNLYGYFLTGKDSYISSEEDPETVREELAKASVFKKYGCAYAGPSNQRQVNMILFKMHDEESEKEFFDRMHFELNELSGGALDTLAEMISVKPMSYEKAFKKNSRISLAFSPSTPSFTAKGFVYYNGSFGEKGCSNGQSMVNGDKIAEYYGLDKEAVYSLRIQGRFLNGVIAKGMWVPISSDDIMTVAANYGHFKAVSFSEFRKLYVNRMLVDGATYVVGDPDDLGFFADENTLKMIGQEKFCRDGFTFSIMSVKSATAGRLNTQDAACIQHLPGAIEFIEKLGKSYIDKEVAGLFEFDGTIVNPDLYYPALLAKISPDYAKHDVGTYIANVKDLATRLIKTINKVGFPLGEGNEYRYLQNDYADMVSTKEQVLKVLAPNEVYMPGKESGIDVDLTRNPKADGKENYMAKTVSLKDILVRIDTLDCGKALKDVIRRMYVNCDTSVVVTPADPKVSASLGGSDNDGDGATCHLNAEYIAVQKQEPEGSSDIPKPEASNRKVSKYDIYVMQEMMFEGIFGQKDEDGVRIMPTGIGIIANHVAKCYALRTRDDEELKLILKTVIKPAVRKMGYTSSGDSYLRHFDTADVRITDADVVKATEDFYRSAMSVEDLRAYLDDCARMASSVEGRAIDTNKTGERVSVGFLGAISGKKINGEPIQGRNKTVRCWDLEPYAPIFEEDENGNLVFRAELQHEDKRNVVMIESNITPVIVKLVSYAEQKINGLLAETIVPSEVEDVIVNSNLGEKKANREDVRTASIIYGELTGNPYLSTDDKNSITYAIRKMLRKYVFDANAHDSEKFAMIKRASVRGTQYSSFQYILPEEYMHGVLYVAECEGWDINGLVGYPAFVNGHVEDGEKLMFHNGTELENRVVTNAMVSGSWYVTKNGSSFYVVRDVKEHFAVPTTAGTGSDFAIGLKNYVPEKDTTKYNKLPDVGLKHCHICNKNYASYIAEGDKRFDIKVPVDSHKGERRSLSNTRLNNLIDGKVFEVAATYQFLDYTPDHAGEVKTIVVGKFGGPSKKALHGSLTAGDMKSFDWDSVK